MRHIHRYIRVRVYLLLFPVFCVADRRSRDFILVFSDKMAENGEVNTDHEGQENGYKRIIH